MEKADFIVRDYCESDMKGIAVLWEQTGLGSPQRGDNRQTIETSLKHGGKFLVLASKNSGQIIGTSWVTSDSRRLYWHHFGILPGFQSKGMGKWLALETMKWAKTVGLQIKLEVHRQNIAAVNMYKNLGFNYLGDYDVYIVRDWGKTNL